VKPTRTPGEIIVEEILGEYVIDRAHGHGLCVACLNPAHGDCDDFIDEVAALDVLIGVST